MNHKAVSVGLGLFSLALGAAELLFPRRISRALDVEGNEAIVVGFGAREVAAGVALLGAPAHSSRVWNRVAGDALDLGTLGLAARKRSTNKRIWGAIAFVAAVTAVDVITAIGLDRATGKALPRRQGLVARTS